MSQEKKRNATDVSRRKFLKDAGIVAALGGAAVLASCAKATTETVTYTAPAVTKTNETTKTVSVTGPATTQTQMSTVTVTGPATTKTTTVTTTAPAVTTTVAPTMFTINNPEGQLADIPLKQLTKRVSGGLAGKTIYCVSVNFTSTEPFLVAMQKIFKEKYPTMNAVYKTKAGSYAASDPDLWAEVKAKAAGFVMAIGH